MTDTEQLTAETRDEAARAGGSAVNTPVAGGRSLWADAWRELRHNPLFWISAVLILLIVLMAVVPQLFTSTDPTYANLSTARTPPNRAHIFGIDNQGYDIYARTIHGARASVLVGLGTAVFTLIIGGFFGLVAGYAGGWLDAVLQRIGDIFFAFPLLLGGLVFLYTFPSNPGDPFIEMVAKIILVLTIIAWPQTARVMRASVLQVKPSDYIQAARALGASGPRIIFRHILPNALGPVIVIATINLGVFIGVEATLSFLGIGLQPPTISWGIDISNASGIGLVRAAPYMLLFPSIFLSITVLAFIMLGDAVRDALDPKLR
ncbi:oligopeptide transport system permease protein [Friedmanniella endophytica]|uniref:Oligopeptide transport system permease protein n=1 Tax=Microlunatus kandeliicorticis TaxID=1759536 RepID=A0A7W3ISP0_9ACTN|nr:ABC transporter permease [Microlunatus kandeliicorticis]MBA8794510.1 oligopeptide transport system permease protein [Microlunatus kandeliicorticis]